jgi:hypothetical protein
LERHIPFIDLLEHMPRAGIQQLFWDWDPHLTPQGHRVVADILYRETRSLLASARAPRMRAD